MSKKNRIRSTILDSNSEELRRGGAYGDGGRPKDPPLDRRSRKNSADKGKTLYFAFVIGVSVLLAAFIIFKGVVSINEGLTSELKVYETDLSGVADGAYAGSFSTAQMSAEVSVAVEAGRITAIRLEKYAGIDPSRAQTVIEAIIRYQQLNVPDDSIGGEHTDKIVQLAVMDALVRAAEENGAAVPGGTVSDGGTEQLYFDIQNASASYAFEL